MILPLVTNQAEVCSMLSCTFQSPLSFLYLYLCEKSFSFWYRRTLKTKKHGQCLQFVPNMESMLKCDLCTFSTKSVGSLFRHKKNHEGRVFKCESCDFQSATKHTLKTHIQVKHEGFVQEKIQCDQCTFSTASQGSLSNHKQKEHNGRVFKCKTCDFQSVSKGGLNSHIKVKHAQIKDYKCELCPFETAYLSLIHI